MNERQAFYKWAKENGFNVDINLFPPLAGSTTFNLYLKWIDLGKPGYTAPAKTTEATEETAPEYYDERFGVKVDPDNPDYVILPTGYSILKSAWDAMSDEEKIKKVGVLLQGNDVYFYDSNGELQRFKYADLLDEDTAAGWENYDAPEKIQRLIETLTANNMLGGLTTDEGVFSLGDRHFSVWNDDDWDKFNAWITRMGYTQEEGLRALGFDVPDDQGGLTDWEKAQLGQAEQDRLDKYYEYQMELGKEKGNVWAATVSRLLQDTQTEWEKGQTEAQNLAAQWEDVRKSILDEIGAEPSGWIKKYQLETKKNPYQDQATAQRPYEDIEAELQGNIDYWQSELDRMEDMATDVNDPFYYSSEARQAESWLRNAIRNARAGLQAMKAGQFAGASTWAQQLTVPQQAGIYGIQPQSYQDVIAMANRYALNPNAPEFANLDQATRDILTGVVSDLGGTMTPTGAVPWKPPEAEPLGMPSWLRSLVQGAPSTVSMTNPAEALNPSGQAWNRLSPIQQSMWGAYAEHAGQSPEDILWYSSQMLPKTLKLGRTWKSF